MNQLCSKPKGKDNEMEDSYVISPDYIAVFDGATPKTAFRFPDGRTPGQVASATLAEALLSLDATITAYEAVEKLTNSLHLALNGHSAEASGVIYSRNRREIWRLGDCPFALIDHQGNLIEYRTEKRIDTLLSDWRAGIVRSYLDRGLMSPDEILANDPGRKIIQPFITRQVKYQNILDDKEELGFGVFDGSPVPVRYIEVYPIDNDIEHIILASDGYPVLLSTLEESENALQQLLHDDPMCIGALRGTKGIRPGNSSFDDRTYIRFSL